MPPNAVYTLQVLEAFVSIGKGIESRVESIAAFASMLHVRSLVSSLVYEVCRLAIAPVGSESSRDRNGKKWRFLWSMPCRNHVLWNNFWGPKRLLNHFWTHGQVNAFLTEIVPEGACNGIWTMSERNVNAKGRNLNAISIQLDVVYWALTNGAEQSQQYVSLTSPTLRKIRFIKRITARQLQFFRQGCIIVHPNASAFLCRPATNMVRKSVATPACSTCASYAKWAASKIHCTLYGAIAFVLLSHRVLTKRLPQYAHSGGSFCRTN